MKKMIVFVITSSLLLFGFYMISEKPVKISFDTNTFNNVEIFDAMDINTSNYTEEMNIEIEGLDVVGFTNEEITNKKGYLKYFGKYTLTYKVYLEEDLICLQYRDIQINVYQTNPNNLILNNDFNALLYKWNLTTQGLSYNVINNELQIIQSNTQDYMWEQKLSQNIVLEFNQKYKLSFDLYCTNSKQLEVSIYQELHDDPWAYNYGLLEYIIIDTNKTTFEFEFTCTSPTEVDGFKIDENNVKLEFKFGKNGTLNTTLSTLYFSNFELIKI